MHMHFETIVQIPRFTETRPQASLVVANTLKVQEARGALNYSCSSGKPRWIERKHDNQEGGMD